MFQPNTSINLGGIFWDAIDSAFYAHQSILDAEFMLLQICYRNDVISVWFVWQ